VLSPKEGFQPLSERSKRGRREKRRCQYVLPRTGGSRPKDKEKRIIFRACLPITYRKSRGVLQAFAKREGEEGVLAQKNVTSLIRQTELIPEGRGRLRTKRMLPLSGTRSVRKRQPMSPRTSKKKTIPGSAGKSSFSPKN